MSTISSRALETWILLSLSLQMNQVTNWLDMSQIYNSKKSYFDQVNRQAGTAKLLVSLGDGDKGFMPRCPTVTR